MVKSTMQWLNFSHEGLSSRPLTDLCHVLKCQYPLHNVLQNFVFWCPRVNLWIKYEWKAGPSLTEDWPTAI